MPEKPELIRSLDNKLPTEFKEFLERENTKNRAWVMVDAMLEENPTLTIEEAFKKAMEILNNSAIDLSDICHNKGDE